MQTLRFSLSSAHTRGLILGLASLLFAACGSGEVDTTRPGDEPVASAKAGLTKGTPGAVNGDDDYCNNAANRCVKGEGDCDSNSQCVSGTVCVNDMGPKWGLAAGSDVCAPSHCENGVLDGGETQIDCGGADCGTCLPACSGTNGDPNLCTGCLCSQGQGDCDRDADCRPGLVCARLGTLFGLSATTDVCVPAHCQNGVRDSAQGESDVDCGGDCGPCLPNCAGAPGAETFCDGCRCQAGQGDCDGDQQCQRGLVCTGNTGSKFGLPYLIDTCMPAHCSNGVLDTASGETAIDCGGPCGACGVSEFDVGTRHACDITSGAVRCWGDNQSGQLGDGTILSRSSPTKVPALTTPQTLVAAGGSHSCALSSAGVLSCWGANSSGQLGNGSTSASLTPVSVSGAPSSVQQLVAGEKHTCIRSNGTVWCWGDNTSGQVGKGTVGGTQTTPVQVSGITSAVFISAGLNHTCAALSDGSARCWGNNDFRKLGNNNAELASGTPRTVAVVTGATQVSVGNTHSCALKSDGSVYCWGDNTGNVLGLGAANDGRVPTLVAGATSAVSLASGANNVCIALSSAGNYVKCWGAGASGQNGTGSTAAITTFPTQVLGATRVPLVKGGGEFMCANTTIAPGVLRCWGDDHFGQLGRGTIAFQNTPQVVWPPPNAASDLDLGDISTCAIAGGQVYCWGANEAGEVGDGTALQRRVPTLVPGISNAVSVAVGNLHACAALSDGSVRCWGSNTYGQFGNGTTTASLSPVTSSVTGVRFLDAGNYTTCALRTNGTISCWGRGSEGELGNGSTSHSSSPVTVSLAPATTLALGMRHACAIVEGNVHCWGNNADGQVGNGSTTNVPTPVQVPGLSNAVSIAAGQSHSCAVLSSGTVYCWGGNSYGQLGGNRTPSLVPVAVAGVSNAKTISTWGSFTCAKLANGEARCWGQNTRGQLGVGLATPDNPTPQALPGTWTRIVAGGRHACGLMSSGQIRCWGYNDYGQTGTSKAWYYPEASATYPLVAPGVQATQCNSDSDCSHGQVCWSQQGPRFDLPEGSSVCVNAECRSTPTPSCGDPSMKCGRCSTLTPRFECVETRPDGSRIAVFGYSNPTNSVVNLAVGVQNQFVPSPASRQQPTTFLPGTHQSAIAVGFTGSSLRWSLAGSDAVVDVSKACPTTIGLPAVADATIKSSSPNASFGAGAALSVSPTDFALISFDREAVLAQRGVSRLVRSARLEVTVASGSTSLTAFPMQQAWDEYAATWKCASDQDASSGGESCHVRQRWSMPRQTTRRENPYDPEAARAGTVSGSTVSFDVTDDVAEFLSGSGDPIAWVLQPGAGAATSVRSRESGVPARLILDTVAFADTDLGGAVPFSFGVDPALTPTEVLPPLADGVARPLSALMPSDGIEPLVFAQNELLVMTDDPAELAAIKARWNALEFGTPAPTFPGAPAGHALRIDLSRADPNTLVENIRKRVNQPDGLQRVSSDAGLRLLAAAASEMARGTAVGINWIARGAEVTTSGFMTETLTDGAPIESGSCRSTPPPGTPTATCDGMCGCEDSSNTFQWGNFNLHRLNEAWKLMHFADRNYHVINAAMVDLGFCSPHQDQREIWTVACETGCCHNPFNCSGGNPCPWHGTNTANAGFGEPNNQRSGAGPGWNFSRLTLFGGVADMYTTMVTIPTLVLRGEQIINFSATIPVPANLSWSTFPAEKLMEAARKISGRLIFDSAGNNRINVDHKSCFDLGFTKICPFENINWFPCETDGVICVGAARYNDKSLAEYSSYGKSVRFYATGSVLVGADPEHTIEPQSRMVQGTSYASPFLAGVAAMTWAADLEQSAGDVEDCLSAARFGGQDGRFVDALTATRCGVGNVGNLPPRVEITSPSQETANFDAVAPVVLTALAADYESPSVGSIFWTSDVEGSLGTTTSGGPLQYMPSGPGLRTITASVVDPQSNALVGRDTVLLSFAPAPPRLEILQPQPGASVFAGLPTPLVARVSNMHVTQTQPCSAMTWTGLRNDAVVFNGTGCSVLATFNQAGNGKARVSATVNGLTGTTERTFPIISDGKLHVAITNPLPPPVPGAQLLPRGSAITLSAASTATSAATFTWVLSLASDTGVVVRETQLSGQNATFTLTTQPSDCGIERAKITVTVVDQLGQMDSATLPVEFPTCQPK
ncbi:MAG: hypothetical protein ACOY0T_04160 [Myxococcota bacterium]